VIGSEAVLWTENIATTDYAEYMLFPRALALAEVMWSPEPTPARDYPGFLRRVQAASARLDRIGVRYAPHFRKDLPSAPRAEARVSRAYDPAHIQTTDGRPRHLGEQQPWSSMTPAPVRRALAPLAVFAALAAGAPAARARTLLTADGPGGTYEMIRPLYGTEVPDCGHPVPHITEELDSELKKNVFVFHAHVNQDDDRCGAKDRQRTEIRGHVDELVGIEGKTTYYRWKFRLPEGFQSSGAFTHIMQVKSGEAAPILTLTPRSGNLSIDGRVGVRGTTALSKFLGVWVSADMRILYAANGHLELTIRRVSDGMVLFQHAGDAHTWDGAGAGGHDPKWGIYRSLDQRNQLRDEQIRFADFCVSHVSAAECDDGAVASNDAGLPPPPADAGAPPTDPPPSPPQPSAAVGQSSAHAHAAPRGHPRRRPRPRRRLHPRRHHPPPLPCPPRPPTAAAPATWAHRATRPVGRSVCCWWPPA
jgi:hypothetical protein